MTTSTDKNESLADMFVRLGYKDSVALYEAVRERESALSAGVSIDRDTLLRARNICAQSNSDHCVRIVQGIDQALDSAPSTVAQPTAWVYYLNEGCGPTFTANADDPFVKAGRAKPLYEATLNAELSTAPERELQSGAAGAKASRATAVTAAQDAAPSALSHVGATRHRGKLRAAGGWYDIEDQDYVLANDYEALRQRFERACAEVSRLSATPSIAPMNVEAIARRLEERAHHIDRREAEGATICAATTLRDMAGELRAMDSFARSSTVQHFVDTDEEKEAAFDAIVPMYKAHTNVNLNLLKIGFDEGWSARSKLSASGGNRG
jgi:hypothetical protein